MAAKAKGGIKKQSFKSYVNSAMTEAQTLEKALAALTDDLELEFWEKKYDGNPAWNGDEAKKWSDKMVKNQNALVNKLKKIESLNNSAKLLYEAHKNA